MFTHPRSTGRRWYMAAFLVLLVATAARTFPQTDRAAPADAVAAEEAREQRAMERFLSILEKTPRRGTPLDRVYGYHVERGSLDDFLACVT